MEGVCHLATKSVQPVDRSNPLTNRLKTIVAREIGIAEPHILHIALSEQPGLGGGHARLLTVEFDTEAGQRLAWSAVYRFEGDGPLPVWCASAAREARFYQTLAPHLPVETPRLIHAEPDEGWLLVEVLPRGRPDRSWRLHDYHAVLEDLAALHAAFWDGRGLDKHNWLTQPIDRNTLSLLDEGRTAWRKLHDQVPLPPDLFTRRGMRYLRTLLEDPSPVLSVLRELPRTLLHRNLWVGNIRLIGPGTGPLTMRRRGRRVFFDWRLAGIGPAPLDVVILLESSDWWYGPLPAPRCTLEAHYLHSLNAHLSQPLDADLYWRALDAANLWYQIIAGLPALARPESSLYLRLNFEAFHRAWWGPMLNAARRLLG
jgi:hypothetical protein